VIHTFLVSTSKKSELIDITRQVKEIVEKTRVRSGLCIIYVPHTTAGVTLNENADPHVAQDILMGLDKVVPSHDRYLHSEGNSPAHIKASLIGCSETVLVESGELVLGTWQGIYFCEFDGPRNRTVHVRMASHEG
jgi:secondary thiamine-phosphate synthase enzyme